mgnify:CR=1 FL=1
MNYPPSESYTSLDDAQSAVFLSMTAYCLTGKYSDAANVVTKLLGLLNHPQIALLPEQRSVVLELLYAWRERLAVCPHQSARVH